MEPKELDALFGYDEAAVTEMECLLEKIGHCRTFGEVDLAVDEIAGHIGGKRREYNASQNRLMQYIAECLMSRAYARASGNDGTISNAPPSFSSR